MVVAKIDWYGVDVIDRFAILEHAEWKNGDSDQKKLGSNGCYDYYDHTCSLCI